MEDKDMIEINVKDEKPNEIVEIDENEEITATQYDLPVTGTKNKSPKKSGGHSGMSRNTKIGIIVGLCVLLVIGIGIIIYFVFFNKKKEEPKKGSSDEETVIVEKDNYSFKNGKLIFKDEDKELGEYACDNNNDVLCYVAYFSNEDEFDVTEKVYESGIKIQNRSDIYHSNYVFVYDNEKKENGNLKLYDIKNQKVIEEYKLVKEINEDKAIVKDTDDNYHILVFSADEVKDLTKDTYDYVGHIADTDKIIIAVNSNYILLDLDGESVSKEVPGSIKNFDDKNISVLVDKEKFLYNYDGEKVIETGFDYIRFVEDYVIGASNKKLYVYDFDGSPMNIDGIRISSNKYNTRLIYGEDLKQTGREVAFDAFVTSNNMRIEYGTEEFELINLSEGAFSKTLDYINYLQGKLYFYSDEAKTKLIGTYTCKNANVVSNDTNELKNCFIATETNILKPGDEVESYVPIYNKKFAFISDVDSTNKGSIILYDLSTSTQKATYSAVDAGYHKAGSKVNFVDTAGTLVAAKNTSNSYGVINIGTSDVTSVIKFRDDTDKDNVKTNVELKLLDKDYLVKRSDGTYHLYNSKGTELTKGLTTSNEIVQLYDKYVKVKSGSKYLIYGLDGTITSLEYKFIYMTDLVYVAVNDSNKIEVYKYSDKNTNLVSEDISVDNTDITANVKGSILTINYTSGGEKLYQEINIDENQGDNNE